MQSALPAIQKSTENYFEKNKDMLQTQLKYINRINVDCEGEYQKLSETLPPLVQENKENSEKIQKIVDICTRVSQASEEIDHLEKATTELEKGLTKVEAKFQEFDSIRKIIKNITP